MHWYQLWILQPMLSRHLQLFCKNWKLLFAWVSCASKPTSFTGLPLSGGTPLIRLGFGYRVAIFFSGVGCGSWICIHWSMVFLRIGQHICASSIEGEFCVFCVFCVYVLPTWTERRRKRLQTIILEVEDSEKRGIGYSPRWTLEGQDQGVQWYCARIFDGVLCKGHSFLGN